MLKETVDVGATSITVLDGVDISDWNVGDEIVIASTNFLGAADTHSFPDEAE